MDKLSQKIKEYGLGLARQPLQYSMKYGITYYFSMTYSGKECKKYINGKLMK